jgi:hypothetical protein
MAGIYPCRNAQAGYNDWEGDIRVLRSNALIGGFLAAALSAGTAHAGEVLPDSRAVVTSGVPYVSASPRVGIKFPDRGRSFEPGAFAPEPGLDAETLRLRAGDPASAEPRPLLSSPRRVIEPGWQFSGRVGPLRWLTPLDHEGESEMRFGGRVYGQPRMPGMGHFNVGINYNF